VNEISSRKRGHSSWPLLLLICLGMAFYRPAASEPSRASHATRQALVGVWRLLSIQRVGRNGPTIDPFYGTDSTGILVYDPSGWMSVQIVGKHRPAMEAPASRPTLTDTPRDAQLKAAVLDTYYAYFGTWRFDEVTSTVTHDIQSSLIPGEAGKSYSQTVSLDDGHLVFTTRQETAGGVIVQKKVWQRVAGPER
jgi:Lipocalin-like domain